MTEFLSYGKIAAVSLVASVLLTPLMRQLSFKIGAVDEPVGGRKIHVEGKPFLGGLAIFVAFCLAVLWFTPAWDKTVYGVLVGGGLMLLLGFVDDYMDMSAKWKFVGQVVIAILMTGIFDVRALFITNPFGGIVALSWLSYPLSVLWIVSLVNVVNFADGLDGLAGGIVTIAAVTLFAVGLSVGSYSVLFLLAALIGAVLGFLPYNFNPSKIIMGDNGAMFLGFVLAVISIEGSMKGVAGMALIVPIIALGLPIFDTALVVWRRLENGQPFYQADREHLHYRLMDAGLTHKQSVLTIYSGCCLWGAAAFVAAGLTFSGGAVVLTAMLLGTLFATRYLKVLEFKGENVKG